MDSADLRNAGVDAADIPTVRVDHGVLFWDPATCPHAGPRGVYIVSDRNGNDLPIGTFCRLCGGWLTLQEGQPALPLRVLSLVKTRYELEEWGYKDKESA